MKRIGFEQKKWYEIFYEDFLQALFNLISILLLCLRYEMAT